MEHGTPGPFSVGSIFCLTLAYLQSDSLLTPTKKPRQLQSSSSGLVFVPRVAANIGTGAFSVATQTLWNSLHLSLRSVENIVQICSHLPIFLSSLGGIPIHLLTT